MCGWMNLLEYYLRTLTKVELFSTYFLSVTKKKWYDSRLYFLLAWNRFPLSKTNVYSNSNFLFPDKLPLKEAQYCYKNSICLWMNHFASKKFSKNMIVNKLCKNNYRNLKLRQRVLTIHPFQTSKVEPSNQMFLPNCEAHNLKRWLLGLATKN